MALTEKAVRLRTAPPSPQVHPNLEGGSHASERAQRRARKVPSFDPRDSDIRHASRGRDVPLPHSPPNADGSKQPAKTQVVHNGE